MNLLCVNCRGCGQAATVQELRELVEQHRPGVVFLSETRLNKDRATALRFPLGFAHADAVGATGQSGGVAILWRGDVTVALLSMSKSHIDVLLSCGSLAVRQWRFAGFYGQPR
jgi:exonuclease III